jgi:hypothetical protein
MEKCAPEGHTARKRSSTPRSRCGRDAPPVVRPSSGAASLRSRANVAAHFKRQARTFRLCHMALGMRRGSPTGHRA